MNIITEETLQKMMMEQSLIASYRDISRGFNRESLTPTYIADLLQIPISLGFAVASILQEFPGADDSALDSIPFHSLLTGVFLPLSGMTSNRVGQLFGISWQKPILSNKELVLLFLQKEIGLSISEKIALLMGDPFFGGASRTGQDTILGILSSLRLVSTYSLRQMLPKIGDIGVLFLQDCSCIQSEPPISCKEMLIILRNLPLLRTNEKKRILHDLFQRCGKLERYFLVRLILRKLNFGYEYRSEIISSALALQYRVPEKLIINGIALSSIFEVARTLEIEGIPGLQKMVIRPLNPISPALAGVIENNKSMAFPLWAECKYDGIRIMVHKETNQWNRTKFAAFTRRKHNWIDLIMGLEQSISKITARSFILDGELHGIVMDCDRGQRPATVYEVYRQIQGNSQDIIRLKYVVFDILYLDGQDITNIPFVQRRHCLEKLLSILPQQLPFPIVLSEGFEVSNSNELEKWYRYFCHQGHEGIIAKKFQATYSLGTRTDDWLKKKAELYLDLILTGGLWATSQRGPQIFSSYILSCRDPEKGYHQIGTAQGLSQENNLEIVQRITSEYLLTGKNVELRTGSGISQGIEIIPSIVVTVRFEDIVKDSLGNYSLRDPKILYVRPRGDTPPSEIDTYQTISELYLKKRLG